MKELIQFSFDFFAYVIPGLFIIFSISILVVPIDSIDTLICLSSSFNSGLATVLVIVAYVIGFCIYPIGRSMYKTLGFTLFRKQIDKSVLKELTVPQKYALIREHSPINFKYVESWNIYCAMAHNLMVACLVLSIVSIIKSIQGTDQLFWIGVVIGSLVLFLFLTYRAVIYSLWAVDDINATITTLNLKDKS